MMESELKCSNELLQQLKDLKTEKETLEKYVFFLIECITIEELEKKIFDLEKKKRAMGLLENLLERLRAEIEPINYLKMTLETKLSFDNSNNQFQLKSLNKSMSCDSKLDTDHIMNLDFIKKMLVSKVMQSQNTQKISPDLSKPDFIAIQKLYDSLTDIVPSISDSISIVNDKSFNEASLLLEQYNVVTNEEILNFSEDDNSTKVAGKPNKNIECDEKEVIENFNVMNLKEELLRGIYEYGFERPTDTQKRAIPQFIKEQDVVVQAPSGSGKTISVLIFILQKIDFSLNECQALILVPTLELALQTRYEVEKLGYFMKAGFHACIDYNDDDDDIYYLNTGSQVVVGTPGCVHDMIVRKSLHTQFIEIFVLDKANKMWSGDFKNQIKKVFMFFEEDIQVILLSTTMSEDVLDVSTHFMCNPVHILVQKEELTLKGIEQFYLDVYREGWKFEFLCDLFDSHSITQAVVFCNTVKVAEYLLENLFFMLRKKRTVTALHEEMHLRHCELNIHKFRSGSIQILIITDFLTQIIDIPQNVSLVINYDLPPILENYIHRIGHSSRFDRKGVAINFITNKDRESIKDLESFYNIQVLSMPENAYGLL